MNKEVVPGDQIASRIRNFRGEKLLDFDLAALYGVETRVLNEAVKRNADRFPSDFMFQLSVEETEMISQHVTSSTGQTVSDSSQIVMSPGKRRGIRYRPYAFTELAKKFSELEQRVGKHDEEIDAILEAIRQLIGPPDRPRREIGFHVREKVPRYRARKRA
jgi:hypothetical protein